MDPYYCITQPLSEYGSLSENYSGDFLSLVLISTLLPFYHEVDVKVPRPGGRLKPAVEDAMAATLEYTTGDRLISKLLVELDPIEFYNFVAPYGFKGWPLSASTELTAQMLEMTIAARVVHWALHSKAVIKVKGNIVTAKFGNNVEGIAKNMKDTYDLVIKELITEPAKG